MSILAHLGGQRLRPGILLAAGLTFAVALVLGVANAGAAAAATASTSASSSASSTAGSSSASSSSAAQQVDNVSPGRLGDPDATMTRSSTSIGASHSALVDGVTYEYDSVEHGVVDAASTRSYGYDGAEPRASEYAASSGTGVAAEDAGATFHTVQGAEDAARLRAGGSPWPTGASRSSLGQGVYSFGSRAEAETYATHLAGRGASDLEVMSFNVSGSDLASFKSLNIDSLAANTFDDLGRVIAQTDGRGATTTFSFNDDGSTIVTHPAGNITTLTYRDGLLVQRTEGAGLDAATWQYHYDPLTYGLALVVDPDHHTTSYGHDAAGDVTSVTDATGAPRRAGNDPTSARPVDRVGGAAPGSRRRSRSSP